MGYIGQCCCRSFQHHPCGVWETLEESVPSLPPLPPSSSPIPVGSACCILGQCGLRDVMTLPKRKTLYFCPTSRDALTAILHFYLSFLCKPRLPDTLFPDKVTPSGRAAGTTQPWWQQVSAGFQLWSLQPSSPSFPGLLPCSLSSSVPLGLLGVSGVGTSFPNPLAHPTTPRKVCGPQAGPSLHCTPALPAKWLLTDLSALVSEHPPPTAGLSQAVVVRGTIL